MDQIKLKMGEDFIKHDHEPCIHTRTLFMFLQLAQFTLEGLLTCKTLGECVSSKNFFFVVTLKNSCEKCLVISVYSEIVPRPPLHTHAPFPTIIEPRLFKLLHELPVCEVSLIKVFFYY